MSLLKSGECFICMHDDIVCTKLANQNIYVTNCKCDGWVHERCHEEWFRLNGSCPICRVSKEELKENDIKSRVKFIVITLIIGALLIYIINYKRKS
jgi:hypothetical protein